MSFWSFIESPFFLISLFFWLISFLLIKILGKKKENVTIFFPFLAMFKTKLFNKLFKKIARKCPKFWKIFWNIGIVVSFCLMIFAVYFIFSNLISLIFQPKPENALIPLIPGVTIDLPVFSEFLIPLIICLTIHEFSHAIAAETDGVNIKSSGILGAGVFFIVAYGAFVEVDEFQLNSRKFSSNTRLRVASAGVWSNIILALICFILLLNYTSIMSLSYSANAFQVESVLKSSEGGFNEGLIEPGDIVYKINGTIVDYNNGAGLDDILQNKTDLKCSIGDELVLTCYNPDSKEDYTRTITLGFRAYVGFTPQRVADKDHLFNITNVHGWELGGNNFEILQEGILIKKINGTDVNYETGNTLEYFLTKTVPSYKVNITAQDDTIYEINVNSQPYFPGAHNFHDVYLGLNYEKINDGEVLISVIDDDKYGINMGNIPNNTIIDEVNGISINLANQTFKDFIKFDLNLSLESGDIINFTSKVGNIVYDIVCVDIPLYPTSVLIGINTESYWIPKNWLGELFGGNFPNLLANQIQWVFLLSFSFSLFNLLPTAIFDGGRMVKEIINKKIGEEWIENEEKMLHYEFDPKESKQHLMTHNITSISSVEYLSPINLENINVGNSNVLHNEKVEFMGKNYTPIPLNYVHFDTSNDGYLDSIEIKDVDNIEEKSIIRVNIQYDKDNKLERKTKIYKTISWVMGLAILSSFIISIAKFGKTLFWT